MKIKIYNIGSIVTWSYKNNKVQTLTNVEILIDGDKISDISHKTLDADQEINAEGALIIPGFIDSHTHPIFIGNRSNEFALRVKGKTYDEIARSGGGILASIKNVRNASEEQLFDESYGKINLFLSHGTTTIEAKSGYGLTLKDEVKSLRVIKKLNENGKLEIIPTFLGAHAVPPEFQNNHEKYVDLICDEMIPVISEEGLAEYCDVFCENNYFTVRQSRKILQAALDNGMKIRLHADEFEDSGAAALAAELGAISADHLMAVSDEGMKAMAKKGVMATLLPGTTLFLGKNQYANGRKMIDIGCDVVLATDFNPGSCTIQSMPLIISLACLYCGLNIEEAFIGSNWNGARSINRSNKIGAISKGYQADLLFFDMESINELPYWMGSDRLLNVMKKGELLDF